ncbi:hypothetical protein DFP72DRAFT_802698, partial [Ephemerocybe angulata]
VQLQDYAVVQFSEPPCMRLVPQNAQVGEEVTVVVPGILCSKTLPPVYGPLRSTRPEHVRYLRQYVRCTGLGSATFGGFQSQLNDIYDKFANTPGVSAMKNFDFGLYEGEYCISMHTRHLTDRRYVSGERHIPFPPEIDPNHVLEDARDTKFIRIEDNVVQYSKKIEAPDGTFYFEPLPPAEFKEGDIVEATGAFVAYPGAEQGEYVLVFCLRALTMICSQYREVSWIISRISPTLNVRYRILRLN